MKKRQINRTLCLTLTAAVLAGSLSVGTALAYFTTYTSATGSAVLNLGFTSTEIKETVVDWTKHIVVENTGDYDCYVRVKIFAGDKYKDQLAIKDASGKWTKGEDDYYYYSDILTTTEAGKLTSELLVEIDHAGLEEDFNVVVVQEYSPVLYDEAGNPYYDWTLGGGAGQ